MFGLGELCLFEFGRIIAEHAPAFGGRACEEFYTRYVAKYFDDLLTHHVGLARMLSARFNNHVAIVDHNALNGVGTTSRFALDEFLVGRYFSLDGKETAFGVAARVVSDAKGGPCTVLGTFYPGNKTRLVGKPPCFNDV